MPFQQKQVYQKKKQFRQKPKHGEDQRPYNSYFNSPPLQQARDARVSSTRQEENKKKAVPREGKSKSNKKAPL